MDHLISYVFWIDIIQGSAGERKLFPASPGLGFSGAGFWKGCDWLNGCGWKKRHFNGGIINNGNVMKHINGGIINNGNIMKYLWDYHGSCNLDEL